MDQNELRQHAIRGIQIQMERLNAQLQELEGETAGTLVRIHRGPKRIKVTANEATPPAPAKRGRVMTPAQRKRLSETMKARWAALKKARGVTK